MSDPTLSAHLRLWFSLNDDSSYWFWLESENERIELWNFGSKLKLIRTGTLLKIGIPKNRVNRTYFKTSDLRKIGNIKNGPLDKVEKCTTFWDFCRIQRQKTMLWSFPRRSAYGLEGFRTHFNLILIKLTSKSLQIQKFIGKDEWFTVIEDDMTITKLKTVDCGHAKIRDWHAIDRIIDENTRTYGTWYDLWSIYT